MGLYSGYARQETGSAKGETFLRGTQFESLAHAWLRLADEIESVEAMLRRLKKPERKAS
jgi:hypothetical protein